MKKSRLDFSCLSSLSIRIGIQLNARASNITVVIHPFVLLTTIGVFLRVSYNPKVSIVIPASIMSLYSRCILLDSQG